MNLDKSTPWFALVEYRQVKLEQGQRIGFRDNMVFVQLASVGSVGSWVFSNLEKPMTTYVLLVVPWVCVVLGWTYIVNDHAISRIGKYVREILARTNKVDDISSSQKIVETDGKSFEIDDVYGWEVYHRIDSRRRSRKVFQWVVDEVTFFLPGILSLVAFYYLSQHSNWGVPIASLVILEFIALITLGCKIAPNNDPATWTR
jgi:hypothetical protein